MVIYATPSGDRGERISKLLGGLIIYRYVLKCYIVFACV